MVAGRRESYGWAHGHGLDRSCEELEIGEGGLIAGDAVFASEFGGGERGLGVDDLEDGGLAGGVAEASEAEAFSRGGNAVVERLQLIVRDGGFGVKLFELRDEGALGVGKNDVGERRG